MQQDKVCVADSCSKDVLKSTAKFSARFLGSMSVDRLFSQTVQPWVMAEIHRKRENVRDVVIEVADENLIVTSGAGEGQQLLFEQHLKGVTRFAKLHQNPKCFAYLTRYQLTADFQCYVYLADSEELIPQLFKAIRESSKDVCSKPAGGETPSQSSDSKSGMTDGGDTDRCKSMFEVKYLGRVKVGGRRVTSDYIDSLAERLLAKEGKSTADKLDELDQRRKKQDEQVGEVWRRRHASDASVQSLPGTLDDVAEDLSTENKLEEQKDMMTTTDLRPPQLMPGITDAFKNLGIGVFSGTTLVKDADNSAESGSQSTVVNMDFNQSDSESNRNSPNASFDQKMNHLHVGQSQQLKSMRSSQTGVTRRRHSSLSEDKSWSASKFSFHDAAHDGQQEDSSESQDSICSVQKPHEASRIMVLQIGQQNISLISLDQKISILECQFKDIAFVSQGSNKQDLFGIVTRDSSTVFFCYMLRCLSGTLVTEILNTLQTAFTTACSKRGDTSTTCSVGAVTAQNQVCTSCPLHQFHRICQDIHTLSSQAAYDLLVKKVHLLPDKEFNELNLFMQTEAPESFGESLEVMMIFLRQLCERKQRVHVHISEANKSSKYDTNLLEEKLSLLEGLKNKAKKSLTTSFEHLLSRRWEVHMTLTHDRLSFRVFTTVGSNASDASENFFEPSESQPSSGSHFVVGLDPQSFCFQSGPRRGGGDNLCETCRIRNVATDPPTIAWSSANLIPLTSIPINFDPYYNSAKPCPSSSQNICYRDSLKASSPVIPPVLWELDPIDLL